jgi:formylglycine-generating enzyme required for sulfatase activity
MLPEPFQWIAIPAGNLSIRGIEYRIPAFRIAKYPLTNAQFATFVDDGGYHQPQWWTDSGWEARTHYDWTSPRFFDDPDWNRPDYPVVGVSWYEAVAFCRWLSARSAEMIRLPSAAEWQWAAQGADGRVYPWGNQWDGGRCNNSVPPNESTLTTSVNAYEGKGDSPYGVVDMVGNVWEWCSSAWETGSTDPDGEAIRDLRGASWLYTETVIFRCDYRNGSIPADYNLNGGMRLAAHTPTLSR